MCLHCKFDESYIHFFVYWKLSPSQKKPGAHLRVLQLKTIQISLNHFGKKLQVIRFALSTISIHLNRPCIQNSTIDKKAYLFFLNHLTHRRPALVHMTALPPMTGLCTKVGISQKWISGSLRKHCGSVIWNLVSNPLWPNTGGTALERKNNFLKNIEVFAPPTLGTLHPHTTGQVSAKKYKTKFYSCWDPLTRPRVLHLAHLLVLFLVAGGKSNK